MSKLSLLLLACLAACAAAQVSVTIPGVVEPDIGAALGNAQKQGKVPGASKQQGGAVAAAPSAGVSQGQSSGQQSGQQSGGQSGIASQLQQAGVGSSGRHLLQAGCFFSGQIGGTGIFVSNLCALVGMLCDRCTGLPARTDSAAPCAQRHLPVHAGRAAELAVLRQGCACAVLCLACCIILARTWAEL